MTPQIAGMITEYNPFHLGHQYHIAETKRSLKADAVVCVMSGSFVQRGEAALLDKWSRASAAVRGGADLVLELPALFAVSSAEYFATAGVHLLNQLGLIDVLSFGSESGSLETLKASAATLSHHEARWKTARKTHPDLSYPALKAKILTDSGLNAASAPNDILGIEYLKAIEALGASLHPFTLQRAGHGYHDLSLEQTHPKKLFSSASAIRSALLSGAPLSAIAETVPLQTLESLTAAMNHYPNRHFGFELLRYRLLLHTPDSLALIHDMEEGLPERILTASRSAKDYESLVTAIKSKRHTRSRIERVLAKILMEIPRTMIGQNREILPAYLRVLAFNERGRALLNQARKTAALPILTRVSPYDLKDPVIGPQLLFDIRATDLREMLCGQFTSAQDMTRPPVYVRE